MLVGALTLATAFWMTWLAHRDAMRGRPAVIEAGPLAAAAPARLSDYLELTKPRLSLLSVLTALAGY